MRADSQTELTQLRALVATLQAALEQSRQENVLLRQKVDALVRRVFGARSEALDPAQLELLLQLGTVIATPAAEPPQSLPEKRAPRSRKESAPRLPENLPLVEQVIDPEPVQAQPELWRCIGQEVNEQLDYEPGRFLRRRIVRRKYVHRADSDRPPPSSRRCPRACANAGWPRPDCWRTSSSANTATTCRSTGRNRSSPAATTCICPGRRWPAGWNSVPAG
jgi:hypothetical protein